MTTKIERRIKIKYRVRNKISGTAERPRMSVFRSNKQIYVQIINDQTGTTLVSASSLGMEKGEPSFLRPILLEGESVGLVHMLMGKTIGAIDRKSVV